MYIWFPYNIPSLSVIIKKSQTLSNPLCLIIDRIEYKVNFLYFAGKKAGKASFSFINYDPFGCDQDRFMNYFFYAKSASISVDPSASLGTASAVK